MPAKQELKQVICVDDDPNSLEVVGYILQEIFGPAAIALLQKFQQPGRAIEHIRRNPPEKASLLITDLKMPLLSGENLGRSIKHVHPNMHVIYFSSGDKPDSMPEEIFFPKTFLHATLGRYLAEHFYVRVQ